MLAAAFEGLVEAVPSFWDWLRLVGAVAGTGAAVKLMDDQLDRAADGLTSSPSSAASLGPGAVPYALASLLLGALLRPDAAAGLFFSAYAAGMADDARRPLPTGLPAWTESVGALAVAGIAAGAVTGGAALALIVFVQCVDDIVDEEQDGAAGARNFTRDLGAVETRLLALACLLVAISLSPALSLAVFVAMAFLDAVFAKAARLGRMKSGSEDGDGTVDPPCQQGGRAPWR